MDREKLRHAKNAVVKGLRVASVGLFNIGLQVSKIDTNKVANKIDAIKENVKSQAEEILTEVGKVFDKNDKGCNSEEHN